MIYILPSNGSILHVTEPVIRSGIRIGTIYLASTIDPLSRRLNRYAMIALLAVMTSLVLAVLGYGQVALRRANDALRSEEHTSELQSLMRISYAVFCLKKKKRSIQKH